MGYHPPTEDADMVGRRFVRLTVLARAERVAGSHGSDRWRCVCDCGTEIVASGSNVRRGNTKSCGCLITGTRRGSVDAGDAVGILLTKSKMAYVDHVDADLTRFNWHVFPDARTDYATRAKRQNGRHVTIRLHVEIANRMGILGVGDEVDHKDGDGLNCRRSNLRAATRPENQRNKRLQRNNTSGIKGVCWDKRERKWFAFIRAGGPMIRLGHFSSKEEAAAIRAAAAEKLHGEFRRDS